MGYAESIIIGKLYHEKEIIYQQTKHFFCKEKLFLSWKDLSEDGFPSVTSIIPSETVYTHSTIEKDIVEKVGKDIYKYENYYINQAESTIICLILPDYFIPTIVKISPEIFDISKSSKNILIIWVNIDEVSNIKTKLKIKELSPDEFETFSTIHFKRRTESIKRTQKIVNDIASGFLSTVFSK